MVDVSEEMAMISLQGPSARAILKEAVTGGVLPEPIKNAIGAVTVAGRKILVARTGYTGEPLGFECFLSAADALWLWDLFMEKGATPVGLGARDTLRLEAGLPRFSVTNWEGIRRGRRSDLRLSAGPFRRELFPLKGAFVGRDALRPSLRPSRGSRTRITPPSKPFRGSSCPSPSGQGDRPAGFRVFRDGQTAGFVTSGTMVPC
jgi:aminomethyltransferase